MLRLPPETVREFVYPSIPSDALTCLPEVIVPESIATAGAQDNDATRYGDAQREAGADCRSKLMWVRDLVATWPK